MQHVTYIHVNPGSIAYKAFFKLFSENAPFPNLFVVTVSQSYENEAILSKLYINQHSQANADKKNRLKNITSLTHANI